MRTAPVLLAALLLVPAIAVVAAGDHRPGGPDAPLAVSASSHSVRIAILTLNSRSSAARTNGSLDLGTALSLDRAATEIRLQQYAFEARLADHEDPEEVVSAALEEIQNRSAALRRSERALWRAYANGSVGETAFLRGLATHYVKARALADWLDRVATIQDTPFLRDPALTALTGPVRSQVVEAIRGNASGRVYVRASSDGVVLAAIADGRYVREAYRLDRQSVSPDALEAAELGLPVLEWYGLSDANVFRRGGQALKGTPDRFTFAVFRYGFTDGSITAYLDGGTELIFYETQTRRLGRLSGRPTATATANDTRLVVNRSYPGGPLRIATYDNSTGAPASRTVTVGGHRIRTGEDGVAWTLTPPGPRFVVTVDGPEGRLRMSVRPTEPVPLNHTA